MKKLLLALLMLSAGFCSAQTQISQLPSLEQISQVSYKLDWLVHKPVERAGVYRSEDGKEIILYNGLLKRTFRIQPNVACVDFVNLANGEQMLRARSPIDHQRKDGECRRAVRAKRKSLFVKRVG